MKFYVHHEDEPEFTLRVLWDDADTRGVDTLLRHFVSVFAKKGDQAAAAAKQLQLAGADGVALPTTARVLAVVEDGGDVFAVRGAAPQTPTPAAAKAPAKPKAASSAKASSSELPPEIQKALAPYLDAAQKAWDKRVYSKAKEIYTELVGVHPKLPVALRRLGEIELMCDRHDTAVPWLLKAAQLSPNDAEVRRLLAKAHSAAGDHEEALEAAEMAAEVATKAQRKRMQIALGRTLFFDPRPGKRQQGGQLLTTLLHQDMEDDAALYAYGEACLELGQPDDALKIYLRMIVQKSTDKDVRRLLARALMAPDGLRHLEEQLPDSAGAGAALAFLATVVKDHSGVAQAIALYERAVRLTPTSASYCLNLMHTIELQLDGKLASRARDACPPAALPICPRVARLL